MDWCIVHMLHSGISILSQQLVLVVWSWSFQIGIEILVLALRVVLDVISKLVVDVSDMAIRALALVA